jgi:hypothetical protein
MGHYGYSRLRRWAPPTSEARRAFARSLIPCVLWIGSSAGCSTPSVDPDFSGIVLFWELAETLQRDETPDASDWDALFATPGYATMRAHDNSDRALKATLPLALMPSRAEERERSIAAGDFRGVVVDHLRRAVERRDELELFRERIEARGLAGDALTLARAWLPAEAREAEAPAVSFVLLEPDARGYERIVMDLAFAHDLGDSFTSMVAHEAHHVFRAAVTRVQRPPGEFPERDLLASLDNLQAEGVADQIDKSDYLDSKQWGEQPSQQLMAKMHERYVAGYREAEASLERMDRLLADYGRDPAAASALGRELRDTLVLGGHPVGFYMARTVLEAFGRERLIEHVGDPFAFVEDYSEAASRLGGERHVFSDEALAGVQRLCRQFRR